MSDRETVMVALFTVLQNAYPWTTSSRRLQPIATVTADLRPAMFLSENAAERYMWQGASTSSPAGGRGSTAAPLIMIEADLVVYTDAKDPAIVGATQINQIMTAIDAALAPDPIYKRCTLSGLVDHVRIDGKVTKIPGDLDGDGMIMAPIVITGPNFN